MAKAKQQHSPLSAAQRRQQARKQRGMHVSEERAAQRSYPQTKKRRVIHNKKNPWLLVIGILVLTALVVAVFAYVAGQGKSSAVSSATPDVQKRLTALDPQLFSTVGAGSVSQSVKGTFVRTKNSPPVLTAADGKPEVFFLSGEFCPYCAAQRWGIIAALSRFGSFSTLIPVIASEGNVPTYTFHGSRYSSQYLHFTPVEVSDNNQPPRSLETLTPEQQKIVSTYDAPPYTTSVGSFPFTNVANQRISTGAFYSYSLLVGHDYPDIVDQIKNPSTAISQAVIGSANYLTAAICEVTNNQPSNVCQEGAIPTLQRDLAMLRAGSANLLALLPDQIAVRRQWMLR